MWSEKAIIVAYIKFCKHNSDAEQLFNFQTYWRIFFFKIMDIVSYYLISNIIISDL